jgi:hypothetical protein
MKVGEMQSERAISTRRRSPPDMPQAKLNDQRLHLGAALRPGDRLRLQHGQYILFHGQLAKDRGLLRQITDPEVTRPQVHRHLGDIFFASQNSPGVRTGETNNHVETGCLAGAVGAQQAHDLTPGDREGNSIDDSSSAVTLADLFCRKRLHQRVTRVRVMVREDSLLSTRTLSSRL